jgi:putative selenium metabolism hydrolase
LFVETCQVFFDATMLDAQRKDTLVKLTQDLIQQKSLAGNEAGVAQVVIAAMNALGYDEVHVDELGNVVGRLLPTPLGGGAGGGGESVMFDSHMDTVEAAGAWTKDPFGGEVSGDRIWGRGTSDMKGALAASLCAAAFAKQDGALQREVLVSASVNEEQIEGLAFADVLQRWTPAFVVICESTQLKLNIGGRGRAEVFITTDGIPAHASTPQLGVNALKQMSKLILALNQWQPPHDADLGYGILEPTEIISHPFPSVSVLPDRCRVRADRRLLVGEDANDVIAPINEVIERLRSADPTFKAHAEIDTETITAYTGAARTGLKFQPAWKFSADHAWIRAAQHALGGPALGYYSFCTNAARSAGLMNIPTIGFGPGREGDAHIADESCELAQLFGAAEGYYKLASISL